MEMTGTVTIGDQVFMIPYVTSEEVKETAAEVKERAQKALYDAGQQGSSWSINVLLHAFTRTVSLTADELHHTTDRREFRRLLGDKLNAIYQEALAEWERLHPEEGER